MIFFIDTEFIEGFHKPFLGKSRHFIDLISIGIVAEDGRTLYRISKEYNYDDADDWVKENVIQPMYLETVPGDARNRYNINTFHQYYGKSLNGIKHDILEFVKGADKIEFYGYYSDYDWVVFCSLFGRMIDLPGGFPMYCRDLKQMMDERGLDAEWRKENCPDPPGEHNAAVDAHWNKKLFEKIIADGHEEIKAAHQQRDY